MSPSNDEEITFKDEAIIRMTAEAVIKLLAEKYPPDQYGKAGMKHALEDYFDGMTPIIHLKHHGWVSDAMTGDANRAVNWASFWMDLAKTAAKLLIGGILMLIGMGALDYIKVMLKSK